MSCSDVIGCLPGEACVMALESAWTRARGDVGRRRCSSCSVGAVAQQTAQKDRREADRRAEERDSQAIVEDRGRRGRGPAGAERLGADVGARRLAEGAHNKEYVPFTVTLRRRRRSTSRQLSRLLARRREGCGRAAGDRTRRRQEGRQERRQEAGRRPTSRTRTSTSCPSLPAQAPRHGRAARSPRRRHLRRLRRREGADADAEERAAAEGVGHQADAHRARLLERRADDELGDRRPAHRSAARAADAAAADRAAVRARHDGDRPTLDTKFTKKAELSTFMLIYNAKTDATNKPDVSVEYNFYTKQSGAPEKFFNKTNPQNLNAQTLPPAVRLSLPAISCRAGRPCRWPRSPKATTGSRSRSPTSSRTKTLTRDVNFTVTAGS